MNATDENRTIEQEYIEKIKSLNIEITKLKKDKYTNLGLGIFLL